MCQPSGQVIRAFRGRRPSWLGPPPARNGQRENRMSASARLESLRQRHASLEKRIAEEASRPARDADALARMKLEKLRLKEEMERLRPN